MFLSLNPQNIFFVTILTLFREEFLTARSIFTKCGFWRKSTTAHSYLVPDVRREEVARRTYLASHPSIRYATISPVSGRASHFFDFRLCRCRHNIMPTEQKRVAHQENEGIRDYPRIGSSGSWWCTWKYVHRCEIPPRSMWTARSPLLRPVSK